MLPTKATPGHWRLIQPARQQPVTGHWNALRNLTGELTTQWQTELNVQKFTYGQDRSDDTYNMIGRKIALSIKDDISYETHRSRPERAKLRSTSGGLSVKESTRFPLLSSCVSGDDLHSDWLRNEAETTFKPYEMAWMHKEGGQAQWSVTQLASG